MVEGLISYVIFNQMPRDPVVVPEGAVEVGRAVARGHQVRAGERAGPVDPPHAGPARSAGVEVAPDHTVAHPERGAGRVALDAGPEGMDAPGHLVPEDLRVRPPELCDVKLAAPLGHHLLEVVVGHSVCPVVAGRRRRVAGAGEPVVEVVEIGLRNLDDEGADVG